MGGQFGPPSAKGEGKLMFQLQTPEYMKKLEKNYDRINKKTKIGKELLYLCRNECIEQTPDIDTVLDVVKEALIEHGHKRYEMPAKVGVHPFPETFYHAMPSYTAGNMTCGIKWIEGYPDNPREYNLPTTTGLIILNDILTGMPICVMDCTWVTALRTPAVTILSAIELHPEAESIMLIGCGVQGTEHVRFFLHSMKNLKRIYVYDSYTPAMDKLVSTFATNASGVEFITGKSFEEMTKNSDIICTATKFTTTPSCLIKVEWAQKGQTYLPQESFSIVDPKIGQICDRFITDSIDEAELFDSMGYFPLGLPKVDCETGEMLAGLKPGRESKEQIIICNNIGMSVNDLAVAKMIYDNALESGVGTVLPL